MIPLLSDMKINKLTTRTLAFAILSFALMNRPAHAVEPQTLFNFPVGQGTVAGALVQGPDGNFYGTTYNGGAKGLGTVFRMSPGGSFSSLLSFDGTNGANPYGGVVQVADGDFYGTTYKGGAYGFGTVFRMTPGGTLTTLHSFTTNGATDPRPFSA